MFSGSQDSKTWRKRHYKSLGLNVEKQLRDEMLAARARYEAHKTPAKVSESGQSYDATGTFVVPGEPPSIFGKEAGDPKS